MSRRLCDILAICTECLVYVCHKNGKLEECVLHLEHNRFLLDLDSHELAEMVKGSNVDFTIDSNLNLFDDFATFKQVHATLSMPVFIFKFVFDCRLLFVFSLDEKGQVRSSEHVKMSQKMNSLLNVDASVIRLCGSYVDLYAQFLEQFQQKWIFRNLSEIESRDLPDQFGDLVKTRSKNREKEKNFLNSLKLNKITKEVSDLERFDGLKLFFLNLRILKFRIILISNF